MISPILSSALTVLAAASIACHRDSDRPLRADSLTATPKAAAVAAPAPAGSRAPAAGPGGVLARYNLAGDPSWETKLPKDLEEISGLAFAPDGRLFAHGDQDATIWQLDARDGKVLKTFTVASAGKDDPDMGKKPAKSGPLAGDFEDLQIVGDRFFLMSSNGVLVEFKEGADGASVPYTAHVTGLGKVCELEGLAAEAADRSLLMLCKIPHEDQYRHQIVIFAWSLDRQAVDTAPRIRVDYDRLTGTGQRAFHGSGMAFAPDGRSLVLIAGPQKSFAEVGLDGSVMSSGGLEEKAHRQPEGIAFAPDGTLLVSDEGAGKRATLSGYAPAR
jgi:hypothetical protein